MSEFVHLIGAEDVRSAASRISAAAQEMRTAANLMSETFQDARQFLEDWLVRFEQAMAHMK